MAKSHPISSETVGKQKWTDVDEIIELSEKFAVSYPKNATTMRCKFLVGKFGKEMMESNINSAYPVIHETTLKLYEKFLELNRDTDLYRNMTVIDFVDRLLTKRAVLFLIGPEQSIFFTEYSKGKKAEGFPRHIKERKISEDSTKQIYFGKGGWKSIGSKEEKAPFIRENCLSYDEIELSSLLSVSSHTVFVNSGSRHNKAVYEENREKVEGRGVIIGLIGPQFKKKDIMEYKRMVSPGGGGDDKMDKFMRDFYECPDPKIHKLNDKTFFNVSAYKKRLAISFETLLVEANSRAREANKKGFIHVVGIGLGVWRLFDEQNEIFVETFYDSLETMKKNIDDISDIRFAYINVEASKKRKKIGNVAIHYENTDPHIRIADDKLLIVSYAWDGNALPGNEFWKGRLDGSSDSAAASSTQITELHNPHINKKICGQNLRIATADRGFITYDEYSKGKKQ